MSKFYYIDQNTVVNTATGAPLTWTSFCAVTEEDAWERTGPRFTCQSPILRRAFHRLFGASNVVSEIHPTLTGAQCRVDDYATLAEEALQARVNEVLATWNLPRGHVWRYSAHGYCTPSGALHSLCVLRAIAIPAAYLASAPGHMVRTVHWTADGRE